MWVKQCNLYHPPVITIFYRWYAYHSQSSVVCGIVLPTYIRLYKCYFMIRVPSFNYCTIIIPSLSIIPSFNHSYTILIPLFVPWFYRCYTIIWPFIYHHSRIFPRPNRFLKGIGRGPSRLAAALGSPVMVDELHSSEAPTVDVDRRLRRSIGNAKSKTKIFETVCMCFFNTYTYIYILHVDVYICYLLAFLRDCHGFFCWGKGWWWMMWIGF